MHDSKKHTGYSSYERGRNLDPAWTLTELANELDINVNALVKYLNTDPTAPKPVMQDKPGLIRAGSNKPRYSIKQVKAWWKLSVHNPVNKPQK